MNRVLELKSKDFRLYLQDELLSRCKKNPNYSLRSFAKNLGISHATLSHVIRGKRKITPALKLKLGKSLGLSPVDFDVFYDNQENNNLRSDPTSKNYQQLTIDTFKLISDWHHDAILELTRVRNFNPDPKWIAKKLGVTIAEVNIAVDRLQRMEMLKITKAGRWVDLAGDNTNILDKDFTDAAARKYQKEILNKAALAIDSVRSSVRDNTSIMVAISTDDISEVKERIKKFRRELSEFLQRKGTKPNHVYQIGIALYPITDIENGEQS